jgi:DNA polymerase-1
LKLLIDADYVVYKCCAKCEDEIDFGNDVIVVTSKFSDAYDCVRREIDRIDSHFDSFEYTSEPILFFSDCTNFRKQIAQDYKGHRNRKKPCGYRRVINQLKNEYEVIVMPTLEADDAMGIYATQNPGNVICSPDKDMKQIPGKVFDMNENTEVTKEEGQKWHLIQTLSGDQTDGYGGVPGLGIKRAVALFEKKGYSWETVLEAFAEKDLGKDVALMNARLAKILTVDDYDFEQQTPILWSPSSSYRADGGAGLQNETTGATA